MIGRSGLFFLSVFLFAVDFETSRAASTTKVTMTTGSFSEREAGCSASQMKKSAASRRKIWSTTGL